MKTEDRSGKTAPAKKFREKVWGRIKVPTDKIAKVGKKKDSWEEAFEKQENLSGGETIF